MLIAVGVFIAIIVAFLIMATKAESNEVRNVTPKKKGMSMHHLSLESKVKLWLLRLTYHVSAQGSSLPATPALVISLIVSKVLDKEDSHYYKKLGTHLGFNEESLIIIEGISGELATKVKIRNHLGDLTSDNALINLKTFLNPNVLYRELSSISLSKVKSSTLTSKTTKRIGSLEGFIEQAVIQNILDDISYYEDVSIEDIEDILTRYVASDDQSMESFVSALAEESRLLQMDRETVSINTSTPTEWSSYPKDYKVFGFWANCSKSGNVIETAKQLELKAEEKLSEDFIHETQLAILTVLDSELDPDKVNDMLSLIDADFKFMTLKSALALLEEILDYETDYSDSELDYLEDIIERQVH